MTKQYLTVHITDFRVLFYKEELEPKLHFYLNPQNYNFVRQHYNELDGKSFYRIDGFFVKSVLRLKWRADFDKVERQSFDFTSLADPCFRFVSEKKLTLLSFGGSSEHASTFNSVIRERYPSLNIVSYDGYRSCSDMRLLIKKTQPDVLLLGLGNMRQEEIGLRFVNEFELPVFTCGAFITQTALRPDKKMQYPLIINKLGLRWLYRFVTEPHVLMRVIKYYPKFLLKIWTMD